jgi:uncharacterized RDD family membrane protein YckC
MDNAVPPWPHAGLLRRLAAICYDLLMVAALMMLLTGVVILIRGGTAIGPGAVWFQLLLVACWWLYFAWSWTLGGQTIGMRAWRIHVTPSNAGRLDFARASLRFVAAALSAAALGLGFLAALIDPDWRTWHDRLSGTELRVRPKKLRQPVETA